MKLNSIAGILAGACLLLSVRIASAAPGLMNYQGRLTDAATGDPITAEVDVTFTFFDAETGGTQLGSGFSDSDAVTPDEDGIYATLIGDDPGNLVPESVFSADSVWLNVAVEGEDLLPRKRITSVGFAVRASQADSATTATHAATAGDAETLDGRQAADFAGSSHGHSLQDLAGAVTDSQVPDDITIDHAASADWATHAISADTATTATYAAYADEASCADRVKQVVRDFVVAAGQPVTAGEVVGFLNGEVQPYYLAGGDVAFNSTTTNEISSAALSSSKFVVAYRDVLNGRFGTAIVVEVSGGAITWGAEYVFNNDHTYEISIAALSQDKFVVAYEDRGSTDNGTAIVGEVSGTMITWGAESIFNNSEILYSSAAALSPDRFVVTYRDQGNSGCGTAIVGDVTGTAISWGAESVFDSKVTSTSAAALSSDRLVVAYRDDLNSSYGTAIVGEVSGTAISWGPESVFNSGQSGVHAVKSMTSDNFVVAYVASGYGKAIVGEVSGTAISWGAVSIYNSTGTGSNSIASLSPDRFFLAYSDEGLATAITGEVSGMSISWGPVSVIDSAGTVIDLSMACLSPGKFVVAYVDTGNSYHGTAWIGPGSGDLLGAAAAGASAGQTVPVILDGISDIHSGLTPGETYYVDRTGSLTTEATGNTKVGFALSDTELLLRIE